MAHMKDGYHLNSFRTKDQLRAQIEQLSYNNTQLEEKLQVRDSDERFLQSRLNIVSEEYKRALNQAQKNAMLVTELEGQVRTQANIVTSANVAKQEALRQYQVATDRAMEIRGELLTCRLALQEAQAPRSILDWVLGRGR